VAASAGVGTKVEWMPRRRSRAVGGGGSISGACAGRCDTWGCLFGGREGTGGGMWRRWCMGKLKQHTAMTGERYRGSAKRRRWRPAKRINGEMREGSAGEMGFGELGPKPSNGTKAVIWA
jgi:hypothetical protein